MRYVQLHKPYHPHEASLNLWSSVVFLPQSPTKKVRSNCLNQHKFNQIQQFSRVNLWIKLPKIALRSKNGCCFQGFPPATTMGFLASTSHGGVELSTNGGFHKWGTHIAGWFTIKTPIKVDHLGVPLFHFISGNPQIIPSFMAIWSDCDWSWRITLLYWGSGRSSSILWHIIQYLYK